MYSDRVLLPSLVQPTKNWSSFESAALTTRARGAASGDSSSLVKGWANALVGRFTFTRLKYTTGPGGYWYQGLPAWAHGYPLSEDNLLRIMNEITYLGAHVDGFNVFSLDTSNEGDARFGGCPHGCFGDQPLVGFDANGFYASTNAFSLDTFGFRGAQIYAMSKAALESAAPSITRRAIRSR